jgi:hypothetical protein
MSEGDVEEVGPEDQWPAVMIPEASGAEALESRLSDNPLGAAMPVYVSVPAELKVELVEVHSLTDYELWFAIASVLVGITVGFYTDWINVNGTVPRPQTSTLLFVISLIFGVMALMASGFTIQKRKQLKGKTSVIEFAAKQQSPK